MQHYAEEAQFIEELRKFRLRTTGQRLAIFHTLLDSRSHPSVEDIFQKVKRSHPTLSISTVYKTVQIMSKLGLVLTIETGHGSQRYDAQNYPHHHAICVKCGKVFDVDFNQFPISQDKKDILLGFSVQGVKITFTGTCQICEPSREHHIKRPQMVPAAV